MLGFITKCPEQNSRRDLAPAVNTAIHQVLGIELEIQPRSAIGNNTGGIE